jgi:uncharacterized protein (TIGR02996 family)
MGLKEDLLQAVREDPQDMTPRLALADYLQENGATESERAYGEYLALCARLSQVSEGHPGYPVMRVRRNALMARHRAEWLGPLDNLGDVVLRPDGLVALTGYRRTMLTADLPALAGAPELACVAECTLRLCGHALSAHDLRILESSPHLADLTGLYLLDNGLEAVALAAVVASPHLRRLVELRLGGNRLGDVGARMVASCPNLPRLTSLDLSRNGIGPDGAAALAGWAHGPRLVTLSLWGNHVGVEGARALASSPRLAGLTSLDLGQNDVADLGARALADSPHLARLTQLDLRENAISSAGVLALLRSGHLARLASLSLWGNPLGEDARAAMRQRFGPRAFC